MLCARCDRAVRVFLSPTKTNANTERQIEELDMTFDAISCYQQLMLAAGKEGFPPVPNTLENALKDETTRIVVTTAEVRARGGETNETGRAWQHPVTQREVCLLLLPPP